MHLALLLLSLLSLIAPAFSNPVSLSTSNSLIPALIPVVIWHGLGDSFDNPGLQSLAKELEETGRFVHLIRIKEDGSDSKATFYGNALEQIMQVCDQLKALEEITSPKLNPSGKFDAIGFSQGGQLLRGLVETCGGKGGLQVRNLITVGSQHMGINSLPPCPPDSSIFSPCHLFQLSVLKVGIYSAYAQNSIIPAQYFREESKLQKYLEVNTFLRDINNERLGDFDIFGNRTEVGEEPIEKRNEQYKSNFLELEKLVLFRFDRDITVIPPQSAHFTLPDPKASNCPKLPLPNLALPCYDTPLPYSSLPLYQEDYIGLKTLHENNKVFLRSCKGVHMEINRHCWADIVSWLGNEEESQELIFQN